MDPNETLTDIRNIIANITSGHLDTERKIKQAYDLLYQFEALDEWLSKGGFLPEAWQVVDPKTNEVRDMAAYARRYGMG